MRKKERKVMEPQIIFEDDFLLVINKPSGMIVNRADTTASVVTVQDWVEKYLDGFWTSQNDEKMLKQVQHDVILGSEATPESEFLKRAGIVHRLDKETSGLLLIAKTPEAFLNLQAQFKNREVKKKYLALVHGKVMPEEGEINAPVGRLPWNRERFGVVPGGKEAVTRYKVIRVILRHQPKNLVRSFANAQDDKASNEFTLLELSPLTGRTHQIRIHLQYLGFPIVGDSFYAGRKQAIEDRKFCPRVFLHASYLSFIHPVTKEKLEFNSPLPEDLEEILDKFLSSPT